MTIKDSHQHRVFPNKHEELVLQVELEWKQFISAGFMQQWAESHWWPISEDHSRIEDYDNEDADDHDHDGDGDGDGGGDDDDGDVDDATYSFGRFFIALESSTPPWN